MCYDIGSFIQNQAYKGIKQADIIFGDLSMRDIWNNTHKLKQFSSMIGLPELEGNQIIIFARNINSYLIKFF